MGRYDVGMNELSSPLVSPEELLARGLSSVVLLDVRGGPGPRARYDAGHVEGALFVDYERELSGDASDVAQGGRHPLPPLDAFAATLGGWGVGPDTDVVVMDDRGGALSASRAWWMLRAVGHARVALLDGGLDAARAAGLPIVTSPSPAREALPPYPVRPFEGTVDIDEVETLRRDPRSLLIDVRATERYRGDNETLDPIAGHIPGAISVPLAKNLGEDGRFLGPDALRALYEGALGEVAPERTVVSCGSGITACHTLLALERAGLSGAKLFVGSWSQWCRTRPGATGDEPG